MDKASSIEERILRDIERYRQVIETSEDMQVRAAMYERIQALENVLQEQ